MNNAQFLTYVLMEMNQYNVINYNQDCNRLTDRMSFYNECLNSYTAIYNRMQQQSIASVKDSLLKAAAALEMKFRKESSSEDIHTYEEVHYNILTSFWKNFNAGAINGDNVKIMKPVTDSTITDVFSVNIQSNIPGFTITVYENVGRFLYNSWMGREPDEWYRTYLQRSTELNDPAFRQIFGNVPYLIPNYSKLYELSEDAVKPAIKSGVFISYKDAFQAFMDLIHIHSMDMDYADTEDFIKACDEKVNSYFEKIMQFFYDMMDVYTNDQFSSGIYKAV